MNSWFQHDHHGRRSHNQLDTDQTIYTFLILKSIFRLTLRALRVPLDSSLGLMYVPLYALGSGCVSKLTHTVTVVLSA